MTPGSQLPVEHVLASEPIGVSFEVPRKPVVALAEPGSGPGGGEFSVCQGELKSLVSQGSAQRFSSQFGKP
jgi:hypothetical protein